MRYGNFLKKSGTIGFVAPSFGEAYEPYASAFNNAIKKFEQLGYKIKEGPNCRKCDGIGISTKPEDCGAEINAAFADEDMDVIISVGGGELMCEILAYTDFWNIALQDPKWFMGYSDNTNLTFLLPTLCDTAAIYGPCANAFGMEEWHPSIQDALNVLKGEHLTAHNYDLWQPDEKKDRTNPYAGYNTTEKTCIRLYDKGGFIDGGKTSFSGRLIGGCLDCLSNLVGTKYDGVKMFQKRYAQDGIVWFLEACELGPFAYRRALWQLHSAGWFDNAKGFIIGRPLMYGSEAMGLDMYDAVTGVLGQYHVPIIMDADVGHLEPMMPLVSGCKANVSCESGKLTIRQHLV